MSDYMSAIAEIERLNAEIERLKEENAHFAWRDSDKNRIIIELAAAVENCEPDGFQYGPLIERARNVVDRDKHLDKEKNTKHDATQ